MEDTKKYLLEEFKDLTFNEEAHKYYVKGQPIKKSVSAIIKNFTTGFDRNGISKNITYSKNIINELLNTGVKYKTEDITKPWDDKTKIACDTGTEVHLFGELYPFNTELKPRNKKEEAIKKFWNDLPDFIQPVIMELRMYHKKYMFAGTADILLYNRKSDTFIIGDYKTNENLFKNFANKYLLSPFEDKLDRPFEKYEIQLSLYQILFEQTGYRVSSRKLIWLLPDGTYKMYTLEDHTKILKEYLKNNEI